GPVHGPGPGPAGESAHRDRRVDRRHPAAAGERRAAATAVEQSVAGAHARPTPVRSPEDDRAHPPARAATLAQWLPVPPSQRGRAMTTRSVPLLRLGAVASMPDLFLERAAKRVGLAAAARIRVGCLTVVLP